MIELKNLYKSYRGKSVLMNISLTIQDNEFFVLIGSSGCGKTTLLKTLNKLNPIDKGEILINGTPINRIKVTQLPPPDGLCRPGGRPVPHMTVEDNIALAMRVAGTPRKKSTTGSPSCWSWSTWSRTNTAASTPPSSPEASGSASA